MTPSAPTSPPALSRLLSKIGGGDQRGTLIALLIVTAFLALVAARATSLGYNFDEGVYIFQARAILDGEHPNQDFFSHQPPLYPYLLAAAGALSDSLFSYRFVSGLATAAAGLFLFAFARRFLGRGPALFALALFLFAPLQFYGLIAFPMGLMNLCAVGGALFVLLGKRTRHYVIGTFFLATGVMFKPLAVSMIFPLAIILLLFRDERKKILPCTVSGIGFGGLYWLLFDLLGSGGFTEVLKIQFWRYSGQGGFELMRQLSPFEELVRQQGLDTALEWNLYEHYRAFVVDPVTGAHPNTVFLISLVVGVVALLLVRGISGKLRLFLALWWVVPFLFSIFVWEPVWDHYFVQYLPGMALTGAMLLQKATELSSRGARKALTWAAAALLLANLIWGVAYWNRRAVNYDALPRPESEGEKWLTFDPFVNVVTGTEPACGLIDHFNVYGENCLAAALPESPLYRYKMSNEDLISCLEQDPEIRIHLGFWFTFFADETLDRYLARQPDERYVSGSVRVPAREQ